MSVAENLRRQVGRRVTLRLAPGAETEVLTGRVLGVLDALDGLVVTVEPDGAPGTRRTLHYHHIAAVEPAAP